MPNRELRTGHRALFLIILALALLVPCSATAATPAAPTNLTANALSPSQIRLDWTDNSSDESYFGVERKDANGIFQLWAYAPVNATTMDMGGLDPGTTYTYRVSAINAGGQTYSNEASATTVVIPVLVITSVTALSTSEIEIRWSDTRTDVMQYWIEITDGSFFYDMRQADAGATSLIVSNLYPNTEYTITIRSMDSQWNFSPYSLPAKSTTLSDTIATTLTAVSLSSKRIKLTWADVTSNEMQYFVEYRKGNDSAYVVLEPLPADTITYTHTNLVAGATYTYRVRSYNGSYYGPYSNEVTLTTAGCVQEGQYIK
jgi:hypothetical protein